MIFLLAYFPYLIAAAVVVYSVARVSRAIEKRRVADNAFDLLSSRVAELEAEVERAARAQLAVEERLRFDRALADGVRNPD